MRALVVALLVVLAGFAAPVAHAAQAPAPTTYYVDSVHGNDTASGTSPGQAWQSLAKVDATTFGPGDRILLRAGDSWTGQLWPRGSGSASLPITIGAYGRGARPRIDGAGQVADAVRLFNQQYWDIRDIEVTNTAPSTGVAGANLGDFRGIHISGDNGQELSHFVIDDVYVHDVTGVVGWIGGTPGNDGPGITFDNGYDGSKRTGGIVFDTTVANVADPGPTATVLNDIVVENSSIVDTSFAGIVVKQYVGDGKGAVYTGWGMRASAADTNFTPQTNIVIRNNYISQVGDNYGCNGIFLTGTRHVLVDHNLVYNAGTSGMETDISDDVVVEHNEVYDTVQRAGGADFNGIDSDFRTTNVVVQYNFTHDNGDGILLCQCSSNFGSVTVRYNVIADNGRYQIYLHSNKGTTADVYNNTVYDATSGYLVYGYGNSLEASYTLRDNVLDATAANVVLTQSPTIDYAGNYYGGTAVAPASDPLAQWGDPMLADPGMASGPLAYRAVCGSPVVNAGTAIAGNGGRDYAGDRLYNGAPDIGAFEYRTQPGATTECVNGIVTGTDGTPLTGVTVTAVADGRIYQTTTGTDGFYRIAGVPFGHDVTMTVTDSGYRTDTATVSVRYGNTTTQPFTLAAS